MGPDGRPSGPSRPEQARVFFALWPDKTVRAGLARAAADCARRFGGRATRPDTLHLTLAFVGDVAVDRLAGLHAAAAEVRAATFELKLDRLGFWGHNRILWAGSSQTEPLLSELARDLADSLRSAGYLADGRIGPNFAPHVTLVRNVGEKRPELPPLPSLGWQCGEFALVRSRLSAQGAAYETLGHWTLA